MANEIINLSTYFEKKRDMDAQETLNLLRSYGITFWSWGAHAFTRIGKKALRMMVNGHHHKGHVYISVNGNDLYDVTLTTSKGTIVDTLTDIYNDQLFEIIDNRIERIAAYVR